MPYRASRNGRSVERESVFRPVAKRLSVQSSLGFGPHHHRRVAGDGRMFQIQPLSYDAIRVTPRRCYRHIHLGRSPADNRAASPPVRKRGWGRLSGFSDYVRSSTRAHPPESMPPGAPDRGFAAKESTADRQGGSWGSGIGRVGSYRMIPLTCTGIACQGSRSPPPTSGIAEVENINSLFSSSNVLLDTCIP